MFAATSVTMGLEMLAGGFAIGIGWHVAGWLVGKVLK